MSLGFGNGVAAERATVLGTPRSRPRRTFGWRLHRDQDSGRRAKRERLRTSAIRLIPILRHVTDKLRLPAASRQPSVGLLGRASTVARSARPAHTLGVRPRAAPASTATSRTSRREQTVSWPSEPLPRGGGGSGGDARIEQGSPSRSGLAGRPLPLGGGSLPHARPGQGPLLSSCPLSTDPPPPHLLWKNGMGGKRNTAGVRAQAVRPAAMGPPGHEVASFRLPSRGGVCGQLGQHGPVSRWQAVTVAPQTVQAKCQGRQTRQGRAASWSAHPLLQSCSVIGSPSWLVELVGAGVPRAGRHAWRRSARAGCVRPGACRAGGRIGCRSSADPSRASRASRAGQVSEAWKFTGCVRRSAGVSLSFTLPSLGARGGYGHNL